MRISGTEAATTVQVLLRTFNPADRVFGQEAVEAASVAVAREQAQSRGLVILEAQETKAPSSTAARGGVARRGSGDLGWWCKELRTLLAAGMTVVEALETIALQDAGRATSLTQRLVEQLQQGLLLSDAMKQTAGFPLLLVAGVKAGERSGGLIEALDDYLRYHEVMAALRSKLVSAAIYPVTVLCIGLIIAGVLLSVVMPRFARLYGELRSHPVAETPWTLQFSAWLAEHGGVFVLLATVLLATLAAAAYRRGAAGVWESVADVLPAARRRGDQFLHAKLFRALALILRGGYPLAEALQVCHSLGLGERLSGQLAEAAAAVQQGQRVSESFAQAGLTDETTRRLLRVGERTGALADVLAVVGQRHADEFELFVTRFAKFAEPAMLLLVALLVGGLVLLMYLPIFEMANMVGA